MPFNVQAALGYAQFQRIDELVGLKRKQLNMYRERLLEIKDIFLNPEPEGGINGAWITSLVFGKSHKLNKIDVIKKLEKMDIPARPFFYPLSSLPAYPMARSKYEPMNSVAYDISSRGINLPGSAILTDEQIDHVCNGVKKLIRFSS